MEPQSRNKKSVALDLKSPDGIDVVRSSPRTPMSLIENLRPGALERLGLGWDVLHALNPGLIMLRISGYGQTGPYRDRPGFGVVAEAMGGMRHLTGEPAAAGARRRQSRRFARVAAWRDRHADVALRIAKTRQGGASMVDVALYESRLQSDGKPAARIRALRRCARARGGSVAGHRAHPTRIACRTAIRR